MCSNKSRWPWWQIDTSTLSKKCFHVLKCTIKCFFFLAFPLQCKKIKSKSPLNSSRLLHAQYESRKIRKRLSYKVHILLKAVWTSAPSAAWFQKTTSLALGRGSSTSPRQSERRRLKASSSASVVLSLRLGPGSPCLRSQPSPALGITGSPAPRHRLASVPQLLQARSDTQSPDVEWDSHV